MSPNEKPWMTPSIKHLINLRWEAYRSRDFSKYSHYKLKVKSEIAKTKIGWIRRSQAKNVWKTVKVLSGKTLSDPLAGLCSQFSNRQIAAEAINEKFSSHFQTSDEYTISGCPQNKFLVVPPSFVFHHLIKLNPRKSSPDLPSKLYNACAHIITDPLTALFNDSLRIAEVPLMWKCATVTAVPKCSSPTLNDLRPISLLPIPVKILERFIFESVKPSILSSYGKNQFGFRPRSSTTSALIAMEDFITSSLDKADVSGVQIVAYDMSKAFDRLKHDVILARLSTCD